MKRYSIILIILLFTGSFPGAGLTAGEVEWATAVEGKLYMGNNLSNGPYSVKAVQFPIPVQGFQNSKGEIVPYTPVDPMVYLEIYKDGKMLKEVISGIQSEAETDPDYEYRISVTEFLPGNAKEWVQEYYNPWAKVSISLRGKPRLEAAITTEKTTYYSNSDRLITVNVNVKNNGDATAKNPEFTLSQEELKPVADNGQLHNVYTELRKSDSKSISVVFPVPSLSDQKTYNFTVNMIWFDIKNIKYTSTGSISITVSPGQNYFTIAKSVNKKRIYLNDIIAVRLTASNNGLNDMNNIILNDNMNQNFELTSNMPLVWNIPVLHPGEWKDIVYSIKPLETNLNGFTLPAANASFAVNGRQYNISSNSPVVVVNGPKIIINKTVDRQTVNIGDDVNVTVNISNIGNIPTRTEVKDFIPENVSLVSGSTSLGTIFLNPNAASGFSYVIRINSAENIELPSAIANYTDVEYSGMIRSAVASQRPEIKVINPYANRSMNNSIPILNPDVTEIQSGSAISPSQTNSSPVNTSTQAPMIPGFGIISGTIILLAVFLMRR